MFNGELLEKYSELVIKLGVNLQKGQGLVISCPVEKQEIAHALTRSAYKHGASIVRVRWNDEIIDRLSYDHAELSVLKQVPKWVVDERKALVDNNFCYISISAEDPEIFTGVPEQKLAEVFKSRAKALKKFSDSVMANDIRWCVVSVPTKAWAKKVFPCAEEPEKELAEAISKAMRLDKENSLQDWNTHVNELERRANLLNDKRFSALLFKNSLGTNLKVGLADDHVWLSAKETAKDGVGFIANMPTEEIFTAPHKDRVNGIVKSAMPLIYNGQLIDNFELVFKNGKIINFNAQSGYEALKHLIQTDKGCLRIGEVALIDKKSPIAKMGILFYNTLFDENASCHLAIGKAYPTTIKNGDKLTSVELSKKGANNSVEHVDFMIGTPDMNVYGVLSDQTETPLMLNGEWVI